MPSDQKKTQEARKQIADLARQIRSADSFSAEDLARQILARAQVAKIADDVDDDAEVSSDATLDSSDTGPGPL